MSLSAIKYSSRLNLKDENEHIMGGIMGAYTGQGYDGWYDFTKAKIVELSFIPTTDWTTLFICHLNNGLDLCVKYKCWEESGYYQLDRIYQLKRNGNVVEEYTQTHNSQIYNPQHSYRPYQRCRQTVAFTSYFNRSFSPSVAGDPSEYAEMPGLLFTLKPATVGDPDPFTGQMSFSDLNDWDIIYSGGTRLTDANYNTFKTHLISLGDGSDPITTDDPDLEPDPSGPGGGDVPSTDGGDEVDFPGLPTTDVIQTGLLTMYNPDNTKLRSLASELWGNDFEQTIKKILNDPFDGIIGLTMIPFTPTTSGAENCKIGNYQSQVSMPLVSAQWMTLNCGSINVPQSWKNALDYSPATTVEIFIPFVGFRELKTEDVMGKSVGLKYNVDLLSGAAVAMVKCGDKVMYTYPCKLTYDVPLTGSNRAELYTGMINIAMSAIKGASMGGALGAAGGAATSAIQTATSKQSNVDRTGAITSNTGDLGDFTPYILIHRPVQSMPADFKRIKGYQSNITALLAECSGYTEVDFIHLTGINGATDTELQEIESLLKEGVII